MTNQLDPTVLNFLNYFKNPIIETLSEWKKEVSYLFDNGFDQYVDSHYRKIYYAKTFLHQQDKIPFYDLFFPIDIEKGSTTLSINSINEVFSKSSCVTIIGTAGSGKSMLMKHFFLNAIHENFKIPILVELRKVSEKEITLIEYIKKYIIEQELSPNEKILHRILKQGSFVFLLDGYDEIFSDKKQKVVDDIESFMDIYSNNNFVLTSRPGSDVELLPRFSNYHIKSLTDNQIKDFVNQQASFWDKEEGFSEKIIKTIFSTANKDYVEYVQNPLLLSLYIISFETNPEIPKKKSKFYSNVFDTLCFRHDSTSKHGWVHEKRTGLTHDEIEEILKLFSFISYFNGAFSFELITLKKYLTESKSKLDNIDFDTDRLIQDLESSLSILIRDGLTYRFPHRSLQEYFTASFIKDKPLPIKEDIYSKKLNQLSIRSLDYSHNFWNLCYELDKYYFYKYFLLPNLYLQFNPDTIIEDEIKEETLNCFTSLDARFALNKYKKNKLKVTSARYLVTTFLEIVRYLNIELPFFKNVNLKFLPTITSQWNLAKDFHNKSEHTVRFIEVINTKNIETEKQIIFNELLDFRNKIVDKIREIENDLDNYDEQNLDILGLI